MHSAAGIFSRNFGRIEETPSSTFPAIYCIALNARLPGRMRDMNASQTSEIYILR